MDVRQRHGTGTVRSQRLVNDFEIETGPRDSARASPSRAGSNRRMIRPLSIPVVRRQPGGEVRRAATRMADEAGLPEVKRGEVGASSPLNCATNLARYGRDGRVILQLSPGPGIGLESMPSIRSRAMADVRRSACRMGFRRAARPATASARLPASPSRVRFLDRLPGKGTVVFAWVAAATAASRRRPFDGP